MPPGFSPAVLRRRHPAAVSGVNPHAERLENAGDQMTVP